MSTLALTLPLLRWLQADAEQWARLPWPQRARLHWLARVGSLNAGLSQGLNREAPPLRDPVFVLGPWRSGSTVMHELLVAASGLPTPRTWQCMNAAAFALTGAPASGRQAARPMDGLPVGPQTPQEDEFALLSLGGDSLYRFFWQPSRGTELQPLLDDAYWQKHRAWFGAWEAFLRGVLQTQGRAGETLLLKSPNHSLRWAAIRERFPAARGVWMLRDATAVYHSNLKMWRQMATLHGLEPVAEAVLQTWVAAAMHALARSLSSAMQNAAPPHLVWQTSLRIAPAETVAACCAALDLRCDVQSPAFASALQSASQGRSDCYDEAPLPADAVAAIAALDQAQAAAWSQFESASAAP